MKVIPETCHAHAHWIWCLRFYYSFMSWIYKWNRHPAYFEML